MKKILYLSKNIAIFLMMFTIMATMFSVNFSAAGTVKINDETFNVGDTVTYTATLKSEKICSGITAGVTYNDSALELDKESVNVPNLGSLTISNTDTAGEVKFIGLDAITGFDFTEGKLLVSMSFKVKDGAVDNDIELSITDIVDLETNVIASDGYTVEEKITAGSYDGEIINPGNGDDIIEEDQKNQQSKNQQSQKSNKEFDKTTVVWMIVAALVVVAVLGTVVFKILKNHKNKNTEPQISDEKKSDLNKTEE